MKVCFTFLVLLLLAGCMPHTNLKAPCDYEARFCGPRTPVNQ